MLPIPLDGMVLESEAMVNQAALSCILFML
jgi:hypothetical protein